MQHLEKLLIPTCKRVPNRALCDVLRQNPDLLWLDISNKLNPKVDAGVVETIAWSCQYLRVLKLSDYHMEDPRSLLVICGRVAVGSNNSLERREGYETSMQPLKREHSRVSVKKTVTDDSSRTSLQTNLLNSCQGGKHATQRTLSGGEVKCGVAMQPAVECCNMKDLVSCRRDHEKLPVNRERDGRHAAMHLNKGAGACGGNSETSTQKEMQSHVDVGVGREEFENAHSADLLGLGNGDQDPDGDKERGEDEDLYEKDGPIFPLVVEDHSSQFGCLELETLWLDNVNLNDQVAAVLMQNLPCLRDLNMSDTDIYNPWRLLDPLQATHLKYMGYLDVKSTALSKTALEMIPKFHPELQKFSTSSTTLPPHAYANIGHLTGVTDLELIGGQFYPCAPEEIFQRGISPAVCRIGKNLCSLNLSYFAHVEFQVIALNCPKIEYLDLSHTTVSFTFPCASLGQCCPYLTSLNLAFCHIDAKEENVGAKQEEKEERVELSEEKVLEIMIGHPPNLEKLHLGGLAVADNTVKTIFPEQSVNPLRTLNISRCQLITISGVQHVWDWCPFIQSVDMTHCREITVTEYHTFEKRCFRDRPRFKMEGKIDWS